MSSPLSEFHRQIDLKLLDRAVDKVLGYWVTAASIILLISISRMIETGWLWIYLVHSSAYLVLLFSYLFRQKIQSKSKALILITLSLLIGIVGLLNYGMFAGGIFFFPLAGLLLMLFYPYRILFLYFSGLVLFFTIVAAAFISGKITTVVDESVLHLSVIHWLTYAGAFVFLLVVGLAILRVYKGLLFDLVSQLDQQNEYIAMIANHDALTGLPLRSLLYDRIEMSIHRADRYKKISGILFVDLDDFKQVNDLYGHQIGDSCLINVSKRMKKRIRSEDTLCRLGGDEFIIVIDQIECIADDENLTQSLIEAVAKPMVIEENQIRVSVSIGISLYPNHAKTIDTLIRLADQAMYQAKKYGKNSYLNRVTIDSV